MKFKVGDIVIISKRLYLKNPINNDYDIDNVASYFDTKVIITYGHKIEYMEEEGPVEFFYGVKYYDEKKEDDEWWWPEQWLEKVEINKQLEFEF